MVAFSFDIDDSFGSSRNFTPSISSRKKIGWRARREDRMIVWYKMIKGRSDRRLIDWLESRKQSSSTVWLRLSLKSTSSHTRIASSGHKNLPLFQIWLLQESFTCIAENRPFLLQVSPIYDLRKAALPFCLRGRSGLLLLDGWMERVSSLGGLMRLLIRRAPVRHETDCRRLGL